MTVSINGTTGLTFNDASTQNTAATGFGFKNRILNGSMVLDQRNAGASVNASGAFPVDRFTMTNSTDGTFTAQQDSSAPSGFTNSVKVTVGTADSSLTTTQRLLIDQKIEGFNVADLGWGTANASTVTLSFWVRSSLTGTFGGSLQNDARNRSYPFTYVVNAADTWEQKSVTVAGDTSGTWVKNNGVGLVMIFALGVGPSLTGTAGAWSGSDLRNATGSVSVIGTAGATFYITGVQLEKGSTATSFDYRPYGTELALCQRYYQIVCVGNCTTAPSSQTSEMYGQANFFVPMRTTPSYAQSSIFTFDLPYIATAIQSASSPVDWNSVSANGGGFIVLKNFSGLTLDRTYIPTFTNSMRMSAEL